MTSSVATKETDMKRLMAIHPIRSIQKVKNLVVGFDPERATPILVGNHGCLLNGTHRYNAYLIRLKQGKTDNFRFVFLSDLDCWVGNAIREYMGEGGDTMYIDIDHFWGDNWTFSDAYDEE